MGTTDENYLGLKFHLWLNLKGWSEKYEHLEDVVEGEMPNSKLCVEAEREKKEIEDRYLNPDKWTMTDEPKA